MSGRNVKECERIRASLNLIYYSFLLSFLSLYMGVYYVFSSPPYIECREKRKEILLRLGRMTPLTLAHRLSILLEREYRVKGHYRHTFRSKI